MKNQDRHKRREGDAKRGTEMKREMDSRGKGRQEETQTARGVEGRERPSRRDGGSCWVTAADTWSDRAPSLKGRLKDGINSGPQNTATKAHLSACPSLSGRRETLSDGIRCLSLACRGRWETKGGHTAPVGQNERGTLTLALLGQNFPARISCARRRSSCPRWQGPNLEKAEKPLNPRGLAGCK